MTDIKSNLLTVLEEAFSAAKKVGRDPRTLKLVAVSKKKPVSQILQAFDAGQKSFGESYAQDFLDKYRELKDLPIHWHFVGTLQRRKVKDVVVKATLIHSVDSLQLAYEINKRALDYRRVQSCLVQVNLSGEVSKSGATRREVISLLQDVSKMKNIKIAGLMTLPPLFGAAEHVRPFFRELRELRDEINEKNIYREPLNELSMGMTHDFKIAIEEGATIIRIGTAIFGERE